MGAIKDVIDLVNDLNSKVEDRKFANELRQIQSMIGTIQSEHAEIHEQRIKLLTENAELKTQIASLNEEIQLLKRQILERSTGELPKKITVSKEESAILVFLSQAQEATEAAIADAIEHNLTKTQFWLTRLSDNEFIYLSLGSTYEDPYCTLLQAGREYLVESNLV